MGWLLGRRIPTVLLPTLSILCTAALRSRRAVENLGCQQELSFTRIEGGPQGCTILIFARMEAFVLRVSRTAAAVLLVLLLSVGVGAYGAWDEQPEGVTFEDLEEIIADLETSINRAETNRSAHPDFLADLKDYLEELTDWHLAMQDGAEPGWDAYDTGAVSDGLLFWVDFDREQYDSRFDLVRSVVGDGELEIGSARIRSGGPGNGSILSYEREDTGAARLSLDWGNPQALTLALWFNADSWGEHSSGYARLFTDDDSTMRLFLVDSFHRYNSNSIVLEFDDFRASTEENSVQLHSWHHVALVWDRGQVSVYIDGRLQELRRNRGSNEDLELVAEMPLRLGNEADGGRQFFGSFDSIMIWDRALIANEIRDLIR